MKKKKTFIHVNQHVIRANMRVECRGKVEMYDQKYHCWKKKGHGVMSLVQPSFQAD